LDLVDEQKQFEEAGPEEGLDLVDVVEGIGGLFEQADIEGGAMEDDCWTSADPEVDQSRHCVEEAKADVDEEPEAKEDSMVSGPFCRRRQVQAPATLRDFVNLGDYQIG
jgi:hypothetical protein